MSMTVESEMVLCVLYCDVFYSGGVLYSVVLCTVLYCTVLYCTVLYCTVLYCTVLYCMFLIFEILRDLFIVIYSHLFTIFSLLFICSRQFYLYFYFIFYQVMPRDCRDLTILEFFTKQLHGNISGTLLIVVIARKQQI